MVPPPKANFDDLKLKIDPTWCRIEALARRGVLSPQMLSSDEVRELSKRVLAYIDRHQINLPESEP